MKKRREILRNSRQSSPLKDSYLQNYTNIIVSTKNTASSVIQTNENDLYRKFRNSKSTVTIK